VSGEIFGCVKTIYSFYQLKDYKINNEDAEGGAPFNHVPASHYINTLRTGDSDLRFYITAVQDG